MFIGFNLLVYVSMLKSLEWENYLESSKDHYNENYIFFLVEIIHLFSKH